MAARGETSAFRFRASRAKRPREELLFADIETQGVGFDRYDPSQRAEILGVMMDGPEDGLMRTSLPFDPDADAR